MGGELRRTFFNLFNMGEIIGHGEILEIDSAATYTLITPEVLNKYTNHLFIILCHSYKYTDDKLVSPQILYKPSTEIEYSFGGSTYSDCYFSFSKGLQFITESWSAWRDYQLEWCVMAIPLPE